MAKVVGYQCDYPGCQKLSLDAMHQVDWMKFHPTKDGFIKEEIMLCDHHYRKYTQIFHKKEKKGEEIPRETNEELRKSVEDPVPVKTKAKQKGVYYNTHSFQITKNQKTLPESYHVYIVPLEIKMDCPAVEIAVVFEIQYPGMPKKTVCFVPNKKRKTVTYQTEQGYGLTVRGKWNADGEFCSIIYVASTVSREESYRLVQETKKSFAPEVYDSEYDSQHYIHEVKDSNLKLWAYPISQKNDVNGYTKMIVVVQTPFQKDVLLGDYDTVTMNYDDHQYVMQGSWIENEFHFNID